MNFLIDTHGLIWFINGDNQLPSHAKHFIKDINNKCYISIASIWEIAIKISIGKLELNGGFDELAKIIVKYDFDLLPISMEHIATVIGLEFHHRDPFDRLIIAQCIVEKIPIITKDKNFKPYKVKTIWE